MRSLGCDKTANVGALQSRRGTFKNQKNGKDRYAPAGT
jgi:hypothetical protein